MIIAVVDDLMFRSRIGTAARGARAEVTFARTVGEAAALAERQKPSLVVVDLDARGLDPAAAIAALKADAALAGVRVIGFVSHVRADAIAAARAAGIDEVLARSAFVSRLPQILAGEP